MSEAAIIIPVGLLLTFCSLRCFSNYLFGQAPQGLLIAAVGYLIVPIWDSYYLLGLQLSQMTQEMGYVFLFIGGFGLLTVAVSLVFSSLLRPALFCMNLWFKLWGSSTRPWQDSSRQIESVKRTLYLFGGVYTAILAVGLYGVGPLVLLLIGITVAAGAVWVVIYLSISEWLDHFIKIIEEEEKKEESPLVCC